MSALKLGFIGLGHIAQKTHLPALAPILEAGEVVLQAFCDVDEATARQAAGEFGVAAVYTDHRAMLEREPLDAVFILIPPTLHTDAELIAAERGIAMLIEKPPTLDMRQALRFEAAIRRSGVVSQVGFMSRYYSAAEQARLMLAERTPRHANVRRFYSGAPIRDRTSRMELCGGSFVENTVHTIDLLRYFYGDIDQVSAFYLDRKAEEENGPMNLPHVYTVNYRYASGVVANATTSRCLTNAGVSRMDVTLISDDSLIDWSPQRITENGAIVWEQTQRENPFALQAAAFVRAVRERSPGFVRSPYSDALNSLAAVLAANESAARGGELVDVKAFTGASE